MMINFSNDQRGTKILIKGGNEIVKQLKEFENSVLRISAQSIIKANREELLKSIARIHTKAVEDQISQKFDIMEQSTKFIGDFIIVLDSDTNQLCRSKSIILLHATTQQMGESKQKLYDCFVQSVDFDINESILRKLLCATGTATTTGIMFSLELPVSMILFAASVGIAYSAVHIRPKMP